MTEDYFSKTISIMGKENVNTDDRRFRMMHELSNGGKVNILVGCVANGVLATEDEIRRVFDYAENAAINVLKHGTMSRCVPDNDE